jgi:peptidoglycan-associated lipoprotein
VDVFLKGEVVQNRFQTNNIAGLLIPVLVLAAGCGGPKKSIETAPQASPPVESVTPRAVTPEAPITAPATDYSKLQPSEMGIKDVYFNYDNYALDDASMRILSQNARILKEHADVVVMVEGHCDERGTFEYNLALGEKRAKGVRDYLVSLGVGAGQLRVTSYGESKPAVTGSSEAAWSQNRRVHFARP